MCICYVPNVFLSTNDKYVRTVRDILSRLGRWIQVLSALNPVDPLHNCMFENKLCLQNVFVKLFCNVPEGSGSWKYNMYFPADEVARKMEYYIVNRGDERKWNKRTGSLCSINLKSSRLGCLVFRGSVSTELEGSLFPPHSIPFHSRPGKRKMFLSGLAEPV